MTAKSARFNDVYPRPVTFRAKMSYKAEVAGLNEIELKFLNLK